MTTTVAHFAGASVTKKFNLLKLWRRQLKINLGIPLFPDSDLDDTPEINDGGVDIKEEVADDEARPGGQVSIL